MLKLLNIVDEFTRECARDRGRPLHRRRRRRRAPSRGSSRPSAEHPVYLRFDHGPEFIADAVADWCRDNGASTVFIDPGSPRGRTP